MGIQHVLQACWPLAASQTTAEIDAEIREELEFHLAMRTRDNLRVGMSAEEARRDAQQRFGDFEVSRRACRQIALGTRLMLQRIQTVLLVVLLGAVVYLGLRLVDLQTANRKQIERLAATIQQLQNVRQPDQGATTTIPFVQWKLGTASLAATEDNSTRADKSAVWNRADDSLDRLWLDRSWLDRSWSDWDSLEEKHHNF